MTSFHILTFGCKINQYETQALREAWEARGMRWTEADAAEVVVVNSCAVTASGSRDARKAVAGLARRDARKGAAPRIILTGCAAELEPDALAKLPGLTRLVPGRDKAALLAGPEAALPPRTQRASFPDFRIHDFPRARAILKVQDGCSHGCTYCVVPFTRGPSVSRDPADILAEARRLLAAGHGELVISGINLRHYRSETHRDFWELLAWLDRELAPDWAGRARLRVSSIDPGQIAEDGGHKALDVLAGARMVCPHLHISQQSGAPSVLAAMNRAHAAPGQTLDFLERLAAVWPSFALGMDLLVGFPGETDADFAETLDFVRAAPLTTGHVFPFSPRPGTKAARFPGRVPQEARKARAASLRELLAAKTEAFLAQAARLETVEVVLEGAGACKGTSELYLDCVLADRCPDSSGWRAGGLVRCRPVAARSGKLLVEPA